MANLKKPAGAVTNKSLADIAAEHIQNTALSNTGTTQSIEITKNAAGGTTGRPMYITVQPDNDIYFAFAPSDMDVINTSNSLWLAGGGNPIDLRIRWGAASSSTPDTVYLQVQRVNAVTTAIRYVVG